MPTAHRGAVQRAHRACTSTAGAPTRSRAGRCTSRTSPTTCVYRQDADGDRAAAHARRARSATPTSSSMRATTPDRRARRPSRTARTSRATRSSRCRCDGAADQVELAAGHDFYAAPRLSPDGRRLAWLAWNHPLDAVLRHRAVARRRRRGRPLVQPRRIAGSIDESLCQPQWSPDGQLTSCRTARAGGTCTASTARCAAAAVPDARRVRRARSGCSGRACTASTAQHEIIATCIEQGVSRLGRIDLRRGRWTPIATDYTDIDELRVGPGFVVVARRLADERRAQVLRIDLGERRARGAGEQRRRAARRAVTLAAREHRASPSERRPHRARLLLPADAIPTSSRRPASGRRSIVTSHGGPTADEHDTACDAGVQLLDQPRLRGGRRQLRRQHRLRPRVHGAAATGQWGIVDVQDCVAAARYLAERGLVDAQRMAIRGGSASGFTTLCALMFHDVFKAGASYYGVSDLAGARRRHAQVRVALHRATSSAPPPERERLYRERSPLAARRPAEAADDLLPGARRQGGDAGAIRSRWCRR